LEKAAADAAVTANLFVEKLDVCCDESVKTAFDKIIEKEKRIDVLVNNAGYTAFGNVEMVGMKEIEDQFNTNVYGVMRCQKAVLPTMRSQKSGKLIVTGSIGGIFGQPFSDIYCATKYAVEGLVCSQAAALKTMGIYSSIVEPGAILTEFKTNAKRPDTSVMPAEYGPILESTLAYYGESAKSAQTGAEVAQVIIDEIVSVEEPPVRIQTSEKVKELAAGLLKDTTGAITSKIVETHFLPSK